MEDVGSANVHRHAGAVMTAATSKAPLNAATDQHEQDDPFRCEIANWPVKDDIGSMEFPIFSLSKNKDLETRTYRRGNRVVKIIPSVAGAATVFDKDLLL